MYTFTIYLYIHIWFRTISSFRYPLGSWNRSPAGEKGPLDAAGWVHAGFAHRLRVSYKCRWLLLILQDSSDLHSLCLTSSPPCWGAGLKPQTWLPGGIDSVSSPSK